MDMHRAAVPHAGHIINFHSVQSEMAMEYGGRSVSDEHFSLYAFNLQQTFVFCVVTYGAIGSLWMVWSKIPKESMSRFPTWLQIGLLCITWCSMSVGMHVLNKTLVVALNAPSLIAIFQMMMACTAMMATSWRQLAEANRRQLFIWMIVPGFFAGMLISSFYTYEFISLSLLTVVRNLAPLVVLPIEKMVMPEGKGPKVTPMIVLSIVIMLAGALVYGGSLKDLSWVGIAFAFLNMALACADRMIQRRLLSHDCINLPLQVCTIMNNAMGMLPTFALAFYTNEIDRAVQVSAVTANKWTDPRILVLLFISGAIGLGICYFGFACQRQITATSFMVMQNTSKIAVVGMGIMVFADPIESPFIIAGLALSIGGSFLYGKAQMDLQLEEHMEKERLLEKERRAAAAAGAHPIHCVRQRRTRFTV
jgi:hypothetical protein